MSQSFANRFDPAHPAGPTMQPPVLSALLLIVGGVLMMVMYSADVIHTLVSGHMITREEAVVTLAAALHNLAFNGCLLLIGFGLCVFAWALRPYARWLALFGLGFAALAVIATGTNIGLLALRIVPSGDLGGIGVIANLVAATLLGIAVLRSRALTRRIGRLLLVTGLITFPIILLTFPLEALLPPFVIADLPFLFLGATFVLLGRWLYREGTFRSKAPDKAVNA